MSLNDYIECRNVIRKFKAFINLLASLVTCETSEGKVFSVITHHARRIYYQREFQSSSARKAYIYTYLSAKVWTTLNNTKLSLAQLFTCALPKLKSHQPRLIRSSSLMCSSNSRVKPHQKEFLWRAVSTAPTLLSEINEQKANIRWILQPLLQCEVQPIVWKQLGKIYSADQAIGWAFK